jgi:hypothetical protein
MEPEDTASDTGFDLDSAMDSIAAEKPATEEVQTELQLEENTEETKTSDAPAAQPSAREMPKSWAKDKEPLWARLDDEAKDYYTTREKQFLDGLEQYKGDAGLAKQFKEILTPYKPMLTAAGVNETDAIKFLLNAQYQMTNGTPEQRRAAYERIGADLGLVQAQAQANVDPAVKQLRDELNVIKSTLTQREQADLQVAQSKASSEVEKFASDKANEHFDAVATDMVPFINAGMSLADAYERAVWGNPVTRALEQAKLQTATEAKLKENARLNGLKARTATSNNVRGTESQSAPTEPKGKLFDDMGDILKEIKARA